ncbi:MAG: protein O-mannosyl-transferase family [Putridiphycobacter sp.]
MEYKKLNNYLGWAVFLIATYTYVATLEPTTSLWDCGEYITTAYKLEVGHPPGAPLFMMLGRLFTVFAGPESAAYMVNLMSALSSSFTILFLFWSITMIAKKIMLGGDMSIFKTEAKEKVEKSNVLSDGQKWAVLGSGLIGALAYTFTDSFWFSAVEGEVYAMSSFFTALVVWAILKWDAELGELEVLKADNATEAIEDAKNPDRWLILIFFMIGLSIGVHLLNLLSIPVIAYIIYFRKYKATIEGFLLTGVIGVAVLGIIQAVIIPGTINLAGNIERAFVNDFGMPFNSGAIFFFVLIIGVIVFLLLLAKNIGNQILYTGAWSFAMVLIGYSCFAMIVIRSNANPPLDENDPENLVSLESYLKREQYGDWPIVYGQNFNAKFEQDRTKWNDRSDVYLKRWVVQKNKGKKDIAGYVDKAEAEAHASTIGGTVTQKYFKTYDGENQKPAYDPEYCTYFPRMYSSDSRHVRGYINWSGANPNKKVTFGENMTYFMSYQFNWMYWRYFMWNFAGRQNDEQGHGNSANGNWMSGINFIDKYHTGEHVDVPTVVATNPSHNKFYMLPLILGLIGFIFTLTRASKSWWIIMMLFLLTGVAIIIYLNQKPFEPRERDYAYAASFYAFAMWIGLSVLALYDAFKNFVWKDLGMITAGLAGLTVVMFAGGKTEGTAMLYITVVIVAFYAVMIVLKNGIKQEAQGAMVATLICLPVPIIMGAQGWDDHNRSDRYTAKALAQNYLNSCSDNSIVYTNGDNDTFPLWYLQEVEGNKTSVRVCNLSLLNTDWYTTQMKRRAYDSAPLPISFEEFEYRQYGNLDAVYTRTTNDMTMASKTIDAETQKLIELKIQSNPNQFKAGFKQATNDLFVILSNSPLSQTQPELVANLNGFDQTGDYFSFRNFVFDLLDKGGPLGLNETQLQNIQSVMAQFNNSFDYLPLTYVIDYLHDPKNLFDNRGQQLYVIPTQGFTVQVDKQKVEELANNEDPTDDIVSAKDLDRVVDELRWKSPKSILYKADLLILDMIANNNWERNIYFASSAASDTYLGLFPYFYNEGLVYKLVPIQTESVQSQLSMTEVNKEQLYDNLMNVFQWGNIEKEGVLVDFYTRRSTSNYRLHFATLAEAYGMDYVTAKQKLDYIAQIENQPENGQDSIPTPLGMIVRSEIDAEKAKANQIIEASRLKVEEVLAKSAQVMPNNKVPYGRIMPSYIRGYYSVESFDKGDALAMELLESYDEQLNYFVSLEPEVSGNMLEEAFNTYRSLFSVFQTVGMMGGGEAISDKSTQMVTEYMVQIQKIRFPKNNKQMYNQTFGGFFQQIQGMMGA